MLVYLAGPYTKPDPLTNIEKAIDVAEKVFSMGFVPFIPHLYHYWDERHEHSFDEWMDIDYIMLSKCDALLRLEGDSFGADLEVEFAINHNIPVFVSIEDLSTFKF